MKNKNNQKHHHRPVHLHIEYFFRHKYCMAAVLAFMFVALAKADGQTMTLVRDAYAEGFGIVGQYMREETSRSADSISIGLRTPTISGQ